MVELRSIETLREALAPVAALRGEQTAFEAWVRESFAALDALHGELSDWQRDLTRQQALLDQRQAAFDDAGMAAARLAEFERSLAEECELSQRLEVENAEQLETLEELQRQLTAAKAELRTRIHDADEHEQQRREWLAELRGMRRTIEQQAELLLRLTGHPAEPDDAQHGEVPGTEGASTAPLAADDVSARLADLRRRAESRRAAHHRPS
jgi:DNA repair exonuclease SbcCD ATPase subunit